MDKVVVSGDPFSVEANFDDAQLKGKLTSAMIAVGSAGRVKIQGKPVCVEGDEPLSIFLLGVMYTAGAFSSPAGAGLVRVLSLGAEQRSARVTVNGKKLMLQGEKFDASFQGMSPAFQPGSPPVPDPMVAKPRLGKGSIDAKETKVKAG